MDKDQWGKEEDYLIPFSFWAFVGDRASCGVSSCPDLSKFVILREFMASVFNPLPRDGSVTIRLPELLLGRFKLLVTEFQGLLQVCDRVCLGGPEVGGNDNGDQVTLVPRFVEGSL